MPGTRHWRSGRLPTVCAIIQTLQKQTMETYTDIFSDIIARNLGIDRRHVENVLGLIAEGCTIPFISRYRKERTGGMDEVQIAAIADMAGN